MTSGRAFSLLPIGSEGPNYGDTRAVKNPLLKSAEDEKLLLPVLIPLVLMLRLILDYD